MKLFLIKYGPSAVGGLLWGIVCAHFIKVFWVSIVALIFGALGWGFLVGWIGAKIEGHYHDI